MVFPEILFEDNHLIIVNKPAGTLVQTDKSGDAGLEDLIKEHIRIRDSKPGNAFLGVVHRLDRPVSGVVIFAKTSKALLRLNIAVAERKIQKIYHAITEYSPVEAEGRLHHYLKRNEKINKTFVYNSTVAGSKEAILDYRILAHGQKFLLVEVNLQTGRHHQIRAQLSHIGLPIKGDLKYGAKRSNASGSISLHAFSVRFIHPVTGEELTITAPYPKDEIWQSLAGNM